MKLVHAAPDTAEPEPAWQDSASCIGPEHDDHRDLWYAPDSDHKGVAHAVSICKQCPVVKECAAAAFASGEKFGIWGGMTARQRKLALRRATKARARAKAAAPETAPVPVKAKRSRKPAECGTRSGYQKHLRDKTEICAPCRQANTDADNRLRRTGTTKELAA
jgi:hypothetical protein